MPVRTLQPTLTPRVARRPEVLAPVGDSETMRVALAAGADAVYFGLDEGFNARARARNFPLDELPSTIAQIHRAGARAYLTLNTLLFESEIDAMVRVLRAVAAAGTDAIIVQDPAVCLLARALCPDLELHASTQMTVSSPDGARFAQTLGVTRVVVPRELSVAEIARFAEECPLELEVFIHGALCMSWSGQCLTSEAWGGRSANRGQCAQSCRMPYDLIVDGEHRPTGDIRYLLSPKDLAGLRAVPALMEIGVHTLKIEGRLKGPAYVTSTVGGLRRWIETIEAGEANTPGAEQMLGRDLAQMMVAYSRGFGDGFLAGSDHQTLVEGRFPKSRGAYLGEVVATRGHEVIVRRGERIASQDGANGVVSSPLPALGGSSEAATGPRVAAIAVRNGMGVVFDSGRPEDTNEPGGPIFSFREDGEHLVLGFGRPGPDVSRIRSGDRVWVTSDPTLTAEAAKLAQVEQPEGRNPISLRIWGSAGEPLRVEATCRSFCVQVASEALLAPASGAGITAELLREKLATWGGSPFCAAQLDTSALPEQLHIPVSQIKQMRRSIVDALVPLIERGPARNVAEVIPASLAPRATETPAIGRPVLAVLCRTPEQLEAAIAANITEIELDWMEMVGLAQAVARLRETGRKVTIATVRVQKPGEEGFDRRIEKLAPDAVLVRHWGAMMHFAEHPEQVNRPALHGDFSLNVTNSITANHLFGLGLNTITAAHDLDEKQLFEMLTNVDASRLAVVVHHHIATFHTEHCVYSHMLSNGRDFRTCGRPCEEHRIALRDHLGNEHPVIVDVGCRNTVFNARAQSAAHLVPRLRSAGVGRLRIEFVWESRSQAADVISAWNALLDDTLTPQQLVKRIGVHEQFGVTAGTMQTLR